MARTAFDLTEGVWTNLGTGQGIVTVDTEGPSGSQLLLNEAADDATAHRVPFGIIGTTPTPPQFQQTDANATTWAKATGPGWRVIMNTPV